MDALPDEAPMVVVRDVWKTRGRNLVLRGDQLGGCARQGAMPARPVGGWQEHAAALHQRAGKLRSRHRPVDGTAIGCEERGGSWYRMRERDMSRQRAGIGMVFQGFNLFPHMSVLDNICDAPVRVLGQPRGRCASGRAAAGAGRAGGKAGAYPRQLSGGQQQRVAIARALAMRAEADAVRRADLRARPASGRRGAGRHHARWRPPG